MATSIYLNPATKFQESVGQYAISPNDTIDVDPDTPEDEPVWIITDAFVGDGNFIVNTEAGDSEVIQSGIYSIACNIPVGFLIGTVPEIEIRVRVDRTSGAVENIAVCETRLSAGRVDHSFSFPAYIGYFSAGDVIRVYVLNGTPAQMTVAPSDVFLNISRIY